MNEVRIDKNKLKDIVAKNRSEHREIFLKAQEAYRAKAIEVLDAQLKRARENQPFELRHIVELVTPQDHTGDYDRALMMLDLSVDDTITLNTADFSNLVQDQWNWSRSWAVSNSNYTDSPKFRSAMEQRWGS